MNSILLRSHSIKSLLAPLQKFAAEGYSLNDCLNNTGITPEELQQPDVRIDLAQLLKCFRNLQRLTGDPLIGLKMGEEYRPSVFGMWGYALLSCATLRQAFLLGRRFHALTFSCFEHSLAVVGELGELSCSPIEDYGDSLPLLCDREMATIYHLTKEIMCGHPPITELHLMHDGMGHQKDYESYFNCPVKFSQSCNRMLFPIEYLDKPLPRNDPETAKLCAQQCEILLNNLSQQSTFVDKVRMMILDKPGVFPDIETIAEKLNVSSRTLRRRLQEEGSSYRDLLNEIRFSVAKEYLQTTSMSVEEIAELLGYSDPGNFTHAFKRWSGESPRDYRSKV